VHRGRRLRAGDERRVIIVKEQGTIFLGGPPLVKAATGEVVSAEDLGGADVHTRLSASPTTRRGRPHALQIARAIVGNLNWRKPDQLAPAGEPREPLYDPAELHGVMPDRHRKPYDVREIIARIVDGSDSTSSRRATARRSSAASRTSTASRSASSPTTASCSRSRAEGRALHRAVRQRKIPLLFLQNITGFMVGRKYETGGIAKDGAKMVTAVATARCRSSR
jgi:3-methylcrotonyl-CoA carboxylase beta subunit